MNHLIQLLLVVVYHIMQIFNNVEHKTYIVLDTIQLLKLVLKQQVLKLNVVNKQLKHVI